MNAVKEQWKPEHIELGKQIKLAESTVVDFFDSVKMKATKKYEFHIYIYIYIYIYMNIYPESHYFSQSCLFPPFISVVMVTVG